MDLKFSKNFVYYCCLGLNCISPTLTVCKHHVLVLQQAFGDHASKEVMVQRGKLCPDTVSVLIGHGPDVQGDTRNAQHLEKSARMRPDGTHGPRKQDLE